MRWSMLLSHHVPADYDRTWKVGSVHVCTRCLGVAAGMAAALAYWQTWSSFSVLVFMIMALPGVLDFTIHELGLGTSSSARRFITGVLFGPFAAALLRALVERRLEQSALFLGWFVLLQMTSALALKHFGRLDQLLRRYEDGVYMKQ